MGFNDFFGENGFDNSERSGDGIVEDCLFGHGKANFIVGIKEHWNPSTGDWNPTTDSHGNGGLGGNGPAGGGNNTSGGTAGELLGAGLGAPGGLAGSLLGSQLGQQLSTNPQSPTAPQINGNLAALQAQQLQNAAQFRANLPTTSQQLGSNLAQASDMQTRGQLTNTNNDNNARGLLYGGVNAGQQQRLRSNNQQSLAQGQSAINSGLQNEANQLDAQAIQTGAGIQQTQQTIQNSIYAQALAQMQAQNAGFAALGSAGGLVAGTAIAAA